MYDYIQIGAWRSDSVDGLHVLEWDAPLFAKAERPAQTLPGRMSALEDHRREFRPEPVTVTLALVGESRAQLRQKYRAISRVLTGARHLILSDMPDYHYRGGTQEIKVLEDYEEWLKFRLTFIANPPCLLRVLGASGGWIPNPATPPAEQITESNCTHNLSLTDSHTLTIGDGPTAYPPEVHMLLLGGWSSLTINGLTIPGLTYSTGVYLDSEAMQVWDKVDGVRTPVPDITGSYESLSESGQLAFSGADFNNATAHILIIERS